MENGWQPIVFGGFLTKARYYLVRIFMFQLTIFISLNFNMGYKISNTITEILMG